MSIIYYINTDSCDKSLINIHRSKIDFVDRSNIAITEEEYLLLKLKGYLNHNRDCVIIDLTCTNFTVIDLSQYRVKSTDTIRHIRVYQNNDEIFLELIKQRSYI